MAEHTKVVVPDIGGGLGMNCMQCAVNIFCVDGYQLALDLFMSPPVIFTVFQFHIIL